MAKTERRNKIHTRIRKTIHGTAERPRLVVFRSLNHMHVQLIDDVAGKTLASASSLKMKGSLVSKATEVGKEIAKMAKEKKISNAVYDRAGFAYKGAVKALCEAVRENGVNI